MSCWKLSRWSVWARLDMGMKSYLDLRIRIIGQVHRAFDLKYCSDRSGMVRCFSSVSFVLFVPFACILLPGGRHFRHWQVQVGERPPRQETHGWGGSVLTSLCHVQTLLCTSERPAEFATQLGGHRDDWVPVEGAWSRERGTSKFCIGKWLTILHLHPTQPGQENALYIRPISSFPFDTSKVTFF